MNTPKMPVLKAESVSKELYPSGFDSGRRRRWSKLSLGPKTKPLEYGTQAQPCQILNNVSLCIMPQESVAITGVSGSGKTTLLSLLAGLDVPTSGHIWFNGQDITLLDEDGRAALRAGKVGFVFQSFQLLPSLTALENVMLPLELAGDPDAESKAQDLLKEIQMNHRLSHYPKQLSGGEQQRVAVARSFVIQPKILFADEPTGNLDEKTGQRIIDLLFDLNQHHKTTLVFVTHDPSLACRCDKVLILSDGIVTLK